MTDATLLIVEDERELADTYARWLEAEYDVRTAYTGEDALDVVDESVDVVLLDRRLPGMTGSEVLDRIRERGVDCRVAMITAVDPDFDILDMRFDDYIVKPVLRDRLHEIVERLLRLATYDDQFRSSFSLASKIRVLEAEKHPTELEESDEYAEAKARLQEVNDRLEETFEEFDEIDYETVYRTLDRDEAGDDATDA